MIYEKDKQTKGIGKAFSINSIFNSVFIDLSGETGFCFPVLKMF